MLGTFVILCVSGLLSYFSEYTRSIATVHTIFGMIFTIVAVLHLVNNYKPLKNYLLSWIAGATFLVISLIAYVAFSEIPPISNIMDYGAKSKAKIGIKDEDLNYDHIIMGIGKAGQLNLDIKRAVHFWHPQIAIWVEDTLGNYKETLFVTKATAKGIFAGGRSKENFKSLDTELTETEGSYRRVNALPVWSHKRGVIYEDGLYAPTYEKPLPDAISGATPLSNFVLKTSVNYQAPFILKFEINVAFDDNEYYSEFDFPDDDTFHNGTGQLGQPSIIYQGLVDPNKGKSVQIMNLEGHGHHSAQDGLIYEDLSKLSTALEIIEFVVLGYKNKNI